MTDKPAPMTKPRRGLLQGLLDGGTLIYAPSYPPSAWAVENGFAEVIVGRFSDRLAITDAGKAAYAAEVAARP